MFSQKNRLRKEKEIQNVFSKGKSIYDDVCGIKYKKNGLEDSRFTIVIGTKVHKRAVKRNHLKRQYREVIKSLLPEIPHDIDMLLLISKKALNLTAEERKERLINVLKKGELLKDPQS